MRMAPALLALCLCASAGAPVAANTITFEIWPTTDPDTTVSCTIALSRGRFNMLEVQGLGMPAARPVHWFANEAEIAVLVAALQALVSGDLASVRPIITSRLPAPPFVTATWMARLDTGLASGLYIQPGTGLPPALAGAIHSLMPGGLCDRALTR